MSGKSIEEIKRNAARERYKELAEVSKIGRERYDALATSAISLTLHVRMSSFRFPFDKLLRGPFSPYMGAKCCLLICREGAYLGLIYMLWGLKSYEVIMLFFSFLIKKKKKKRKEKESYNVILT